VALETLRSKLPHDEVSIFAAMTRLATEQGAINLSQGFPDFDPAPELIESVARYMRAGHNQYAPMPGVLALREALSDKIALLYGRRYDPVREITVTSGATEAMFAALTALVHPGDEVILFQPVYDSYVPAVLLSGGTPRFVTLQPPSFRIDWDDVRRLVSDRTRVIVLNSPHNPTGTMLSREDLLALETIVQATGIVVIADEVYEHIVFDGERHESVARYPGIAERAVVISSFGKTYTATGWKVGYCAAPPALTTLVQNVHQWIVFAVNGAIQMAFADAVRADPHCAAVTGLYQRKRDLFLALVARSRFRPLVSQGTFFQLLDYSAITDRGDRDVAIWMTRSHGVASIPLSPFLHQGAQAPPVVRFCFAKRDETLARAAERLCAI
jgi:methionine aminotransferase